MAEASMAAIWLRKPLGHQNPASINM